MGRIILHICGNQGDKVPKASPGSLDYIATIVKAARDYRGKNWLAYDYRFRQLAAALKTKKGWGQKNLGLWNETFVKPKNQENREPGEVESTAGQDPTIHWNVGITNSKYHYTSDLVELDQCHNFPARCRCHPLHSPHMKS